MQPSPAGESRHSTPLDALLRRAERTPDATAFIADSESWSCRRLAAESAALAEALSKRGIRAGDRVALHMHNRPEAVLAYFACWRMGAIAVPLNTRYKTPELVAMLKRIQPAIYLGEAALYAAVREVDPAVLALDARFVVDLQAPQDGARPWAELAAVAGEGSRLTSHSLIEVDRDAPAILLATSGTTGPSKLAVWTLRTLGVFEGSARESGMADGDVLLVNLPVMHAAGSTFFATCILTGAVAVLLPQFDPDAVLDAIHAHRCTTFAGLPFMCAAIARHQKESPRDLGSLRLCLVGGDACSEETAKAFQDAIGHPLLSRWAATEEGALSVPAGRPGPLVSFRPEVEVRLTDTDGVDVADGEDGEMLVRCRGTTPGYWLGPGRIDPLPEGWFHSGDLVRREADGQMRYRGRNKDLIVRGGSNISPIEVEEVLRRQPGVADAAVVGLPDPELGERVGAALVLVEGTAETAVEDILAGARRELADYKIPETTFVVASIPRTALNKIDRHATAGIIADDISSPSPDEGRPRRSTGG